MYLNGAGIRYKWIFEVYVAGLYLPQRSNNYNEIITMPGPKQVHMHFLMAVSRKRLLGTLDEGFSANHTKEKLISLENDITKLKTLFKDVRKNDIVIIEYLPAVGTRVWLNDTLQGVIAGEEFYQSILRIWIGERPADKELKKLLLGYY